jgi:hypothetical protein
MLPDPLRAQAALTFSVIEPAVIAGAQDVRRAAAFDRVGGTLRHGWRRGLFIALILHLLLLGAILLVRTPPPDVVPVAPYVIALEPWPLPVLQRPARAEADQTPASKAPVAAGKPVPVMAPVATPVRPVEAVTPVPNTVSASPPQLAAPSDPQGVVKMPDQRQVMAGMSARNAAGAAIVKHDICVYQRTQGKDMDKDCQLVEGRKLTLGPIPKPPSDRQICIAKRHEYWKRYREGKADYPGLINWFKGNSDCRKGWDD